MQTYRIAENRLFQINGHEFIFLSADNAIFELNPEMKDILENRFPSETLPKESFLRHLDGSDHEKELFFNDLIQRRIVVCSETEKSVRPGAALNRIPLKTLVLQITDDCNLGCHYCYYCDLPKKEKQSPMTLKTAQESVDFLMNHSGGLEEVILVFFGGEPLLNFSLICAASDYAQKKAEEKGKKISFSITTNATLLTDRVIRFLNDKNFSVTISIDGGEEIHDRHRRFLDGTPSYRVILPKIRNLLEIIRNKPVTARVTVSKGAVSIPETADHLLGIGFAEVGFAPVTTQNPDYQLCEEDMNQMLDHFRLLSDQFLKSALNGRFFGFTNLIDLLVSLHEGEVKTYPCGAGLGLFSADAEGRLYLCQRLSGEDAFCMGDIYSGFDHIKLSRFRFQTEISQKAICKSCWARTICAGGCYHEALLREGSLFKPNLHYCQWIQQWFEIGFHVYAYLAAERPEYLDKLSMLRGK